jgi:hypothetical protein
MSTGRLGAGDTAIQPTILNAKADLLTATAADTPARLAVGATEQFLQPRAVRQQGYSGLRLLLVERCCRLFQQLKTTLLLHLPQAL